MDVFDMQQIVEDHNANGELYHEFFNANRLSVGTMHWINSTSARCRRKMPSH